MQSSNNEKKSKFPKTVLIILLTVIAACILMVGGYIIINHFTSDESVSDKKVEQTADKPVSPEESETRLLSDEVLKDGGSLLVFAPDVKNSKDVSSEDMETVRLLVRSRLDSKGYPEATIETDNSNNITVAIPGCEIPDDAAEFLKTTAKLEFIDAEGNVIMDGSPTYIKGAVTQYGQTSEYGESQHYVQINFTEEGQKKFKEATQAAVQAGGDMQFISVALDGKVQMSPRVNEVIDSESCVLTGDYTQESAKDVATFINSGLLPFGLKTIKFEYIAP